VRDVAKILEKGSRLEGAALCAPRELTIRLRRACSYAYTPSGMAARRKHQKTAAKTL